MHALPRLQSLLVRCGGAFLFTMLLAFALHAATGLGGAGMDRVFNVWVYDALMLGAAGSCLLRAAMVERERLAWGLLGVGLAAWTGGEIYYSAALAGAETVPIPSLADAGYLLFYPLAYAALIVLMRNRIGSFPVARWLDGLVVGTAIAALAAAVALGPIVEASTSGDVAAVVTNLAYPIADLTLLTLVFTASAFTGWRPGLTWLTLGSGLIVLAVSDGVYLLQSAQGTYAEGGILDVAWPLGALLLASAAWQEPARRQVVRSRGLRVILVPATAAVIAIGIQFSDRSSSVPTIAAWLSLLTLLAVVVRMMVSFRENQTNLESSVRESLTDSLTALANRRRLMATSSKQRRIRPTTTMSVFSPSLTSTASRPTTTPTATPPATRCWPASVAVWRTSPASAPPPTGSAATSSVCWPSVRPQKSMASSPAPRLRCRSAATASSSPVPRAVSCSPPRPVPVRQHCSLPTGACTRIRAASAPRPVRSREMFC
jgi:hypothetical protein